MRYGPIGAQERTGAQYTLRTAEAADKRLSFILPTYNCAAYVDEGIESVREQLPDDCELVVVDDGSTDGTAEALAARARDRNAGNLRIALRDHRGASGARNAGLDAAHGEYVAFIDCDDMLQPGFLAESLPLLASGADLYIFGIERVFIDGKRELWSVRDRSFATASDFADAYIRERAMLIYSNCNKFYRRSVIERHAIRFDEGVSFGEDRLFNYAYLMHCGAVVTSELVMLRYLQRSEQSQSTRDVPGYLRQALALHDAKARCFLALSKGTTEDERRDFVEADLRREVRLAEERIPKHPEEGPETLAEIERLTLV